MLKSIKNEKRAEKILRSLLTSGYRKIISSESFGLYVLRHQNGNEFVLRLNHKEQTLRVTKNGKLIEL